MQKSKIKIKIPNPVLLINPCLIPVFFGPSHLLLYSCITFSSAQKDNTVRLHHSPPDSLPRTSV
ncbi:hypothetical protein HanXRQr2_Chr15g0703221 [Helianthus annuus]|uniref:Uncharacterized protein n=1 Tax=Helianthus annuus TaxID=4232 RepID=A0A9K3H2W1_HELAN|nr:hypothetical protein HanXRQr2_Chr15g0703221 [Helianthus annuus]